MENKEEYTMSFVSPKTLAEEMLVSLVKTGIKTYREVNNAVDSIQKKANAYQAKGRETIQTAKAVPKTFLSNIRMSIQKKIDKVNQELAGIKSNIRQKIEDIKNDKYEIKKSNISIHIPKPTAPKIPKPAVPKVSAANIELELIKPTDMAQTLHESTGEIKQSSKEVLRSIGILASAVGKLIKNLSPVKHKESTPLAAAAR